MSRFSILFFFFFALAAPSMAALPPLDDSERHQNSTNVFRGEIRAIYSRKKVLGGDSSNLELPLEIEVVSSEKGALQKGQVVHVHCWVIDQRPAAWVGDGGQRPHPREGATGLFFVRESQPGEYRLLHPNGWEPD